MIGDPPRLSTGIGTSRAPAPARRSLGRALIRGIGSSRPSPWGTRRRGSRLRTRPPTSTNADRSPTRPARNAAGPGRAAARGRPPAGTSCVTRPRPTRTAPACSPGRYRSDVGPGAPHGARPLEAAHFGTRGYRGPTHSPEDIPPDPDPRQFPSDCSPPRRRRHRVTGQASRPALQRSAPAARSSAVSSSCAARFAACSPSERSARPAATTRQNAAARSRATAKSPS